MPRPFDSLQQAITMLDTYLAAHDGAGLIAWCSAGGRCDYLRRHPEVFEVLAYQWGRVGPFRQLYAAREFPAAGGSFKLGGHMRELGHVHIDFVRVAGGWALDDIWKCR